jgi:multiple sugar transport system permease protein
VSALDARGAVAARSSRARRLWPRRRSPLTRARGRAGILLVSPAVVLVLVFFVVPLVLVAWMSLHNWPLLGTPRFIGGANYGEMISDDTFRASLWFTTKYTLIVTPIQLALGYLLASMVRGRLPGVRVFRTIYFLPVVVGFAAGAYVFYVMMQPQVGVVDAILGGLGLVDPSTGWLTNPSLALVVVIVLVTWKTVGTAMILFMVAMQGVSPELYEAAEVDGAGWWRKELSITLPLVRRTTALVLILTVTGSFLAFDQFFILTQGGPNSATLTTVLWIYTNAFVRYRLGYSATLCVVVLAILIVLSMGQIRILRTED